VLLVVREAPADYPRSPLQGVLGLIAEGSDRCGPRLSTFWSWGQMVLITALLLQFLSFPLSPFLRRPSFPSRATDTTVSNSIPS
jgi:hypothetical protein